MADGPELEETLPAFAPPMPGSPVGCEIRPPDRADAWAAVLAGEEHGLPVGLLMLVLVATGLLGIGVTQVYRFYLEPRVLTGSAAVAAVVERIILVESNGDANARNRRSSATGAGQFLDATWLEMIRTHRPDLARGRSERDVLDLRRHPELSREIATRWVERNAAMLSKRGFPVTPGTLYLTYFAGPAGAVAVLSFAENADAASLLASADASGRTT